MKKSTILSVSVILLVLLNFWAFTAYSQDNSADEECPLEKEVTLKLDKGSRLQALKMIAIYIDMELVISDEIMENQKGALHASMNLRITANAKDAINILLMGTTLYSEVEDGKLVIKELQKPTEQEESVESDNAKIVLVATLKRIDDTGYSGIVGSSFNFHIEDVTRFESKIDENTGITLLEILKRNKNIEKRYVLEVIDEFFEDDLKAKKHNQELKKRLEKDKKYIIVIPCWTFLQLGPVRDNMWGSVWVSRAVILDYSEENLEKVDALAKDEVNKINGKVKQSKEKPTPQERITPVFGDKELTLEHIEVLKEKLEAYKEMIEKLKAKGMNEKVELISRMIAELETQINELMKKLAELEKDKKE